MSVPSSPPVIHREAGFGFAFRSFFEVYKLLWQCRQIVWKVALLLVTAHILWTLAAAVIAPDFTVSEWVREQGLAFFNRDGTFGERIGAINDIDNLAFVYLSLALIGGLMLWFVKYVVILYVVSQYVWHRQVVTLEQIKDAWSKCPASFFKAVLYKWFYPIWFVAAPLGVGVIATFLGAEAGFGDFFSFLVVIIMIVGVIVGLSAVLYWFLNMLLLECMVLFRAMTIQQAKAASLLIMRKRRGDYFAAAFCAGIVLWIGYGITISVYAVVMAEVLAAVGSLGATLGSMLAFLAYVVVAVLDIVLSMAGAGWIFLLYDEWSKELDVQEATPAE